MRESPHFAPRQIPAAVEAQMRVDALTPTFADVAEALPHCASVGEDGKIGIRLQEKQDFRAFYDMQKPAWGRKNDAEGELFAAEEKVEIISAAGLKMPMPARLEETLARSGRVRPAPERGRRVRHLTESQARTLELPRQPLRTQAEIRGW